MAYTPIDKSDDYFTPYLWTGDGAVSRVFTGVGLQADMMWSKIRGPSGHQHNIVDTVRGVNQRLISPNSANAEDTTCTHGHFDSLDADGFTITGAGGNWNVNASGNTYVGWNWKGGGTAVSNTAGSITSSVSANTTAGFSIVSYTGTGAVVTIGHGLGVVPAMIIVKVRSSAGDWSVYHTTLGNTKNLKLNTTAAEQTSINYWNNTSPDVDKFTVYNESNVGGSGLTYIAYCFAEVKGFSKFGSYTGNGSTDGTFVYTGFKPAFVMLKSSSNAGTEWVMHDIKRSLFNPVNDPLLANSAGTESVDASWSPVDFLSNGFKLRTTDTWLNGSGYTYIYIAFAENPFVTSTTNGSIPATAR
jgi:hypothetical protein